MKTQPSIRFLIFVILVVAAIIISWQYPFLTMSPKSNITENALQIIRVISEEPHSFRHSEAREKVGRYLAKVLEDSGLQPIFHHSDSIPTRIGSKVSLTNIYTEINPPIVTDSTSYLLLIAHYDSTGKPSGLDSTRYSYGAADDGYGIGIIYGLIKELLPHKREWKQGLRILFTDLEEEYTAGMKDAVANRPEIFKNVNIAINVEARGIKGPALLFETSPGNEKLIELYSNADNPYAYSLTSIIYRFMPNYTDFGCISDKIPGMNFAVIDNLNYYHTHLDHYAAVSPGSLNHYGEQLLPMIKHYLISELNNDPDRFRSEKDNIFFTFPPFGLLNFDHSLWLLVNICCFVLFVVASGLYFKKYGFKPVCILRDQFHYMATLILTLGCGTGFSWLISVVAGRTFKITHTLYVPFDMAIATIYIIFWNILLFTFWCVLKQPVKKEKWWSILFTMNLISLFTFISIYDNFFILIPAIVGSLTFIFSEQRYGRWLLVAGSIFIILIEVAFLKQLFLAITFGALGIITMLSLGSLLPIAIMGWYWINKKGDSELSESPQ